MVKINETEAEKKEQLKSEIDNYIKKVAKDMFKDVPEFKLLDFDFRNAETNDCGGDFSIFFHTLTLHATLIIYEDVYNQYDEFNEDCKNYIKASIGHEFGHLFLSNLEGTSSNLEKKSSYIGFLLKELFEYRNPKVNNNFGYEMVPC
jgi:hypothetical protein